MATQKYPIDTSKDTQAVATILRLIPVETNRITCPHFCQNQIRQDAADTRIIVHHRFPQLVEAFLAHKRAHGTDVEKSLYRTSDDWTWQQQVARLVEKRALTFVGGSDHTLLRDGTTISYLSKEWDRVGTDTEAANKYVKLQDYLSYDEMMLGSLVGVSGPSYFINDGSRYNMAKPGSSGSFENRGVIVGLVGARFERPDRMDSVFCRPPVRTPKQHPDLTAIFTAFFRQPLSPTLRFNRDMFKSRIRITIDMLLLEANQQAKAVGKKAYVHVVGLGLGVWQVDRQQPDDFLVGFVDALEEFGDELSHIETLNFAYIDVHGSTAAQMKVTAAHLGIDVVFSRRNHADTLPPTKKDELLVVSYAWDSNAFPGNEYWGGSLAASGDPAAACMSTIAELHNPVLNPQFLSKIEELNL